MIWGFGARILGVCDRNRPKHGAFLSCMVALLCVGQSIGVKSTTERSLSAEGVVTTISMSSGVTLPNSIVSSISTKNSSRPNVTRSINSNMDEISSEEDRFKVASFDWDRVQTPMLLGLAILSCTLAKLVFHFHHKLSSFCPESCLLIVIGVIIGLILYAIGILNFQLDTGIFFFYMIPPIILDAGYFIPNRSFFDNIGTVLLYGIVGTTLSTFALGLSLWALSLTVVMPFQLGVLQCLAFSALISAIDPMSVLAVFNEVHVTECLYIIVFGESLLNNGLSVVLFQMFEGLSEIRVENIEGSDIAAAIGSFLVVTICGTLTGIMFGFLASLLTRVSGHVPVIQPLLVIIMGYIAYVFAEMFHLSGILSCAFCGITMRKYVKANMSKKSHTTTKYFLKLLASIAETMIFVYLGISTVINNHQWDWGFCILALVFCLVIRAGVVTGLTAVINTGRLPKLSVIDQFIMSYGSLRGAIAFSLVIDLSEDLFPFKKMYFTTTVLIVMFTNFVMGSTIKPIVEVLKVSRTKKSQQSFNDQIHRRLMEHLMTGIEDITGHHGHHQLREKYEYIDKHYLQKAFVRHSSKNGWNASPNYDKLSDKEAKELETKSSYGTLFRHFQQENGTMRNFSFMKWLSSVSTGCMPNGYPAFGAVVPKGFDPGEQSQIDLQVMDAQDTRKMRDDSKVHHIIEDSMFVPRKRFLEHRRHILPPDGECHQQQLHHKARLHLRHLMSHHHRHHDNGHHSCNGSIRNNSHSVTGKPKKNVSFAEVTQVTKDEIDTDIGSTRAESGASDDDKSGSDIGGITFTAVSTEELDAPLDPDIPVEPVAVETFLPWKRNTGREPLSSAMTHSMPDDQCPLLGEAPSWVNNTEYTSPGSPPVTPQSQHHGLQPAPLSQTSSCACDQDQLEVVFKNPQMDSSRTTDEVNLILLDTPDHKPAIPHNRDIREEKQDDNHDRTTNGIESDNDVIILPHNDISQSVQVPITPESTMLAENGTCLSVPSSTCSDVQSISASPLKACCIISQDDRRTESNAVLPWRSDSNDVQLPWRGTSQSVPAFASEHCHLPWRQDSYDMPDEHPLPWRNGSVKESDQILLPWRQTSLDSSDETSSLPMSGRNGRKIKMVEGDGSRYNNNSDSSLPVVNKSSQPCQSELDVPLLPWRDNSNVEVKLDQSAPRPRHTPSPNEEEKEVSHVPPPPWRHNPEPDCSVRSPSASCEVDMYSLRPQLSSHSFRFSEAESKHSEPIHVHHMIELPQPRPHIDFDCESTCSLDLDSEEIDVHERVTRWLITCDPQPLKQDDLQAMPSISIKGNNANTQPVGVNTSYSNSDNNNAALEAESIL